MSKQVIKGKGNLYNAAGELVATSINYEVWRVAQTEDSPEEWGGNFTIDRIIWPFGEFIIELKDGRRGRCLVTVEESLHPDYPTLYHYGLEGMEGMEVLE